MNGDSFGRTDARGESSRGFEFRRRIFGQEDHDAVLFVLVEYVGRLENALSGGYAT
jgi:hypothetical protein